MKDYLSVIISLFILLYHPKLHSETSEDIISSSGTTATSVAVVSSSSGFVGMAAILGSIASFAALTGSLKMSTSTSHSLCPSEQFPAQAEIVSEAVLWQKKEEILNSPEMRDAVAFFNNGGDRDLVEDFSLCKKFCQDLKKQGHFHKNLPRSMIVNVGKLSPPIDGETLFTALLKVFTYEST